jgi:hypothetical protein
MFIELIDLIWFYFVILSSYAGQATAASLSFFSSLFPMNRILKMVNMM